MNASYTLAQLEGAYHFLTDSPEPNWSVGALAVQVEGQLAVVGSLQAGSHDPKTASEPLHEVGNLIHKFGKTSRDHG